MNNKASTAAWSGFGREPRRGLARLQMNWIEITLIALVMTGGALFWALMAILAWDWIDHIIRRRNSK